MRKQIKTFAIFISILIIFAFVIFVINQVAALYANVSALNPMLGNIVLGAISPIFLVLIVVPIVMYLRLPSPLKYPEKESQQAYYLKKVASRLSKNKLLQNENFDLGQEEGIKAAMQKLDIEANDVIYKTASNVFLTTAISQNGKLDALTVLIIQTRMIWKVSHVYWHRPALRDMINLYANVAGTTFLTAEVENLDISKQMEPILSAMLKSPGRSLPIVGHAAHIVMDSLLEGSINAFLTLRVGIISRRYCSSLQAFDKAEVRKNAFLEASGMLKNLVVKSSGNVISSILKATKNAGFNTIKSGAGAVGKAAGNVKSGIESFAEKIGVTKKKNDKADEG
ncbi:DUF697 domain-containing protein [Fulvivirgaceae bacterium BMA10]|uniref:DUF697 domain-containing protein n=1 Tax=Splendidivirga corallicola TaxID=3051826 RepID=A0ABT8KIG0_9BACT|nr:DUF697 domain-containing protein [Fulvivirgaceae bacterium BMA10]